jgi:polyisoprenoid-binding protein YceI
MKQFFVLVSLVFIALSTRSQDRLLTRSGFISFYSDAPLEKIEANTRTAASVLDKKTGQVEFSVLIKSFSFRKALMQEHFNENYLESDKFPKSVFIGRINDVSKVDFDKDAEYAVTVTGQLTIHGVTRTVTTPAILTVKNRVTIANATFNISLTDYKISIPSLVKDKISETVKIVVNLEYES